MPWKNWKTLTKIPWRYHDQFCPWSKIQPPNSLTILRNWKVVMKIATCQKFRERKIPRQTREKNRSFQKKKRISMCQKFREMKKLHLKDSTQDHLAKSTNPKSQNSKIWFDNIFKIFEISNRPKTSSIFIKTSKTIRKTIQIPWRYHDVAIFITAFQFLNIVSEFGGWIFDHGQNWSWYLQGIWMVFHIVFEVLIKIDEIFGRFDI